MNGVETADTVGFQGLSQPGRVATASKYSTVGYPSLYSTLYSVLSVLPPSSLDSNYYYTQ